MLPNKQNKLKLIILLTAVAVAVFGLPVAAAAQEVYDVNLVDPNLEAELQMPGTVEGTGTYFELTDSNYLNITLESSEPVNLRLESVPEMVVMDINSTEGAASTQITLTGFPPSTTYYKYEDDYHNEVIFTTDLNGSCTFAQDLTQPHLVFIQPSAGTIFIPQDTSVGTWDPVNRIYTLTTDVYESIQIDEDNLILDGAGYTITGPGFEPGPFGGWSGFGVYLYGRTGVTIKNVNVQGFTYGIHVSHSSGNTLTNNTASNNRDGINLSSSSSNALTGNTASSNRNNGIYLYHSSSNTLTSNTASNNYAGIYLGICKGNTLRGNTMSGNRYNFGAYPPYGHDIDTTNTVDGKPVYYVVGVSGQVYDSSTNAGVFYAINCGSVTIKDLTVTNNLSGVYLWKTHNSRIENVTASNNVGNGIHLRYSNNNTLTGNTTTSNNSWGIYLLRSSGNTVTGNTVSNNYWGIFFYCSSDNQIYNNNFIENWTQADVFYGGSGNLFNLDTPIGGNYWSDWTSPDADGDGFVDKPYVFHGGRDNLPWTRQDGWLNQPPVANAEDNIQIPSADQAYTVIQGAASDPDGDLLEYRWLEGEVVLLDWSPVGANGEVYLDLGTLGYFSIGNHSLTLEVSDGQLTASDEMILTLQNSPPEAQPAPSSQVVEIGIDDIVVVADVADFDGDTLSYDWLKGSEILASGSVATVQGGGVVAIQPLEVLASDARFPLGVHTIELRVTDAINDPVSAFVSVEVTDTTAPSLSPIPSVTILWPPNHELHPVTIAANAFDNGGGAIVLDIAVQSSELPDTTGDGSTVPDYYIDSVDNETGLIELRLRAERQGKGDGRTYTITITATDESGNESVATVEVLAPHDRRKK